MSSIPVQRGALHVAAGTEGEKDVCNELKTLSSPALTIHQPPLPASNEQKKKTVAVRGRWRPLFPFHFISFQWSTQVQSGTPVTPKSLLASPCLGLSTRQAPHAKSFFPGCAIPRSVSVPVPEHPNHCPQTTKADYRLDFLFFLLRYTYVSSTRLTAASSEAGTS